MQNPVSSRVYSFCCWKCATVAISVVDRCVCRVQKWPICTGRALECRLHKKEPQSIHRLSHICSLWESTEHWSILLKERTTSLKEKAKLKSSTRIIIILCFCDLWGDTYHLEFVSICSKQKKMTALEHHHSVSKCTCIFVGKVKSPSTSLMYFPSKSVFVCQEQQSELLHFASVCSSFLSVRFLQEHNPFARIYRWKQKKTAFDNFLFRTSLRQNALVNKLLQRNHFSGMEYSWDCRPR